MESSPLSCAPASICHPPPACGTPGKGPTSRKSPAQTQAVAGTFVCLLLRVSAGETSSLLGSMKHQIIHWSQNAPHSQHTHQSEDVWTFHHLFTFSILERTIYGSLLIGSWTMNFNFSEILHYRQPAQYKPKLNSWYRQRTRVIISPGQLYGINNTHTRVRAHTSTHTQSNHFMCINTISFLMHLHLHMFSFCFSALKHWPKIKLWLVKLSPELMKSRPMSGWDIGALIDSNKCF